MLKTLCTTVAYTKTTICLHNQITYINVPRITFNTIHRTLEIFCLIYTTSLAAVHATFTDNNGTELQNNATYQQQLSPTRGAHTLQVQEIFAFIKSLDHMILHRTVLRTDRGRY